jgi:alpha-ketoglutarate-dependent 2,4-dichlorophenoxyacetate dioxygenase
MMRFPTRSSAGSTRWWRSIRSSIRGQNSALPISATRSAKACRRCRKCLVRTLPESGRKSLYLASHAGRIFGMPEEDGRALIDELVAHATQRQFIYTHRWRVHDLIIWDNRCTMHRGTDFDDLRWKRDLQRATVCDLANSCEQAGIRIAAA